MSLEAAKEQVEETWGGRAGYSVRFCACQKGDHWLLEFALGQAQKAVLENLDDPGDLQDSYHRERFDALAGAVSCHLQYGHELVAAWSDDELLGAASFLPNYTARWYEEPEKPLEMQNLLEVSNLGTTGRGGKVGAELMTWMGALAALRGQEVTLHSSEGAEGFYEGLGMETFSPGLAASRYLWRKANLPVVETQDMALAP